MKVSHDAQASELGLAEIFAKAKDAVRRRWLVLLLVAAAVFAAGVAVVLMLPPKYSATALVRIDPSRNPLSSEANQILTLTPEAIETEVTIIRSAEVARKVVRNLNLTQVPAYTKGMEGTMMSPQERENIVVTKVLDSLGVSRDKLTYVLGITFTSDSPTLSARVANEFVKAYLETKVGSKTGTAERQAEWFKQRLDTLGTEIRETDARVAQYRAEAGITQGAGGNGAPFGGTIVDQQVAPLTTQLAIAKSEAAAARSNLAAAEAQASRGGPDAVSEVLNSPVIGNLRAQRAEVLRSMGEVQARYGERHPESIRVRDQLASIDVQIREETKRVLASLRSTADAASARVSSLQASVDRLGSDQARNTRSAVLAESLEREAAAKRNMYDKLSQMSLQSTQASTNSIAQAEIVDTAKPPIGPTSPNRPLLIAVVFILAIVAGAGTVTVQELLVTGFRTVEEVESKLGLPVLAALPALPKNNKPADMLLEKPTSFYSEALRIARASLLGVRGDNAPKIIAVTSALPSEGKTTTSLALARTMALNNARTLLFECDVRRAVMQHSVRSPVAAVGTVEVVMGEAPLDSAITPGDVPHLDHLLVTTPYFSSGDLFGDGNMEAILKKLRERYDVIILDLPPIIGLADGRFLAALADTTAVVVHWDKTPTHAVSSALGRLRSDGANLSGVILNMVDSRAESIGSLYYSKEYAGYYHAA